MSHSNISIFIPNVGCPHLCSFCNQRTISGQVYAPAVDEVAKELDVACLKLKNPTDTEIAFFGGSFTAIDEKYMDGLLEAAEYAVKKFMLQGIRISTRPDCIDDCILDKLQKYGVTSIELGAQSMRDEVLKANMRGHSAQDIINAAEMIRKRNIELGLQMMTGLYKSDCEDDIYTCNEIIKLKPRTVRIYPTVILKGTYLAQLLENGCYKPVSFEKMTELCALLLEKFEDNGIRVIRLGLHASDNVKENAVGGFYHPAFCEICRSIIDRRKIEKICTENGSYEIHVMPRLLSEFIGQKKANVKFFAEKGIAIKFIPDAENENIRAVKL